MNYGKTAYLKVLDIEKELFQNSTEQNNLSYFESSKLNINQNITDNQQYVLNLNDIYIKKNQNLFFQIKSDLFLNTDCDVSFELIINDLIIHSEVKSFSKGNIETSLLKTYTPLSDKNINVELHIKTETSGATLTIKDITTIILGAENKSTTNEIELRAIELPLNNKVLISYIDNNDLFYKQLNLTEQTLSSDDFTFLSQAKSHCFCLEKYSESAKEENLYLYRVDLNNNLYYSNFSKGESEILIEKDVSVVHSTPCPLVSDDSHIITYIKNNSCYFRTFKNGLLSNEKELYLPKGKYKDIRVISKQDCENIYIIATNENNSNYILHSLAEVSTGKISEFINAKYSLSISKYIDLGFINKLATEHLNVDLDLIIKSISYINQTIEKQARSYLSCDFNLNTTSYVKVNEITYGVKLDKAVLTGTEWGSYTDDAQTFSGAYMDFTNDTFVDNGWNNRFPFNQIKPCLFKDGKVVGYLNPNDFTLFENLTASNITSVDNGIVMIEIPKIYYKISKDNNYIYVQISNTKKDGFVCNAHVYKGVELDKIYISAYLCGATDLKNRGFSIASQELLVPVEPLGYTNEYYNIMKTYDGERFETLPYNVVVLIQCLYIIMFKNTNSQASLGSGYSGYQKNHQVGLLDKKGMNYGTTGYVGGVKFLGLEDIYSCRKQLVTGYYLDSELQPKFIDVYNPNMSYHPDDRYSYITTELPFTKGLNANHTVIDINEDGNNLGFFSCKTSFKTNMAQGFCDACQQPNQETAFIEFGCRSTNLQNGIFSQAFQLISSYKSEYSVRLVYYPET